MPPKRSASPARPSRSPARARPSQPLEKSPKAAKSPKATKSAAKPEASKSAAASGTAEARRAELVEAREKLGLLSQPLRTSKLFVMSAGGFVASSVVPLLKSGPMLLIGYPFLLGWLLTSTLAPGLYAEPGCSDGAEAAGALYYAQLFTYEAAWWLTLGVLSSIGFGTGLHSGIMFLWPFVMQVVLTAEACGSTAFVATYNHPCALQCGAAAGGASFLGKLLKVLPAAILWGVGTAFGELPPYFVTRAAKRTGKRDDTFDGELEEAKEKTDLISKLKVWTIDFTQRHGFLGVYLLASWPNAAFDMCGMACGWLEMPFWTFIGATVAGKGFTKVTLQCVVCVVVFSKGFFDGLMLLVDAADVLGLGLSAGATFLRSKVMAKFDLQKRFTADGLLAHMAAEGFTQAGLLELSSAPRPLDQTALAQKYCSMGTPPVCGARSGRGYGATWEVAAEWDKARAAAARVLGALDADGDGALSLAELQPAQSRTDGKLSLASLDPGDGGLLSVGALWNVFLAALILFFVVSIVDQVAKLRQADADEAELAALEAKAAKDQKKKK